MVKMYNTLMMWMGRGLAFFIVVVSILLMPRFVLAQRNMVTPKVSPTVAVVDSIATGSAEATAAAMTATPAAQLIVEKATVKKQDITETQGPTVGKLGQYVLSRPQSPLGVTNFLQYAIRLAILSGMPGSTIVLVLLFPLVAAMIAAARHLIGLRGFGIFTPAVLSVAFVATGIVTGIFLFVIILSTATLSKNVLKKAKLQYLPRMALLLWFVCVGVLVVLLGAPLLQLQNLMTLSIFPILILVLLAETFIEVQFSKSKREATELTVETIILALISSLVLSLEMVQRFAMIYPELLLLGVGVFDVFMGRYVGLRYTEYRKFKKLLK